MKLKGLMFYLLTEFGKQIQFPCSSLLRTCFSPLPLTSSLQRNNRAAVLGCVPLGLQTMSILPVVVPVRGAPWTYTQSGVVDEIWYISQ